MIQFIGVAENPATLDRIRRWLTNTYGSSVTRVVQTTPELASLCILNTKIDVIIADLPPGKELRDRYDELKRCDHGQAQIILINSGNERLTLGRGERELTIVPLGRLEESLQRILHVR